MSLIIQNLTKCFDKKKLFSDFSYEFKDKGLYLLRGDSGAGKTTLLRMISGLDKNFSGSIIGGGASNVSFAFQEYRLFPSLNAIENVMIASKVESQTDLDCAKLLLKKLGLSEEDTLLYPSELSGGMKQRVSLARAFLKSAPILILDEPTKELDEALVHSLYNIIKNEAQERLVLLSTHDNIPEDVELLATITL